MAADQGLRSAAQWAVAKLQSEATPPNPSD